MAFKKIQFLIQSIAKAKLFVVAFWKDFGRVFFESLSHI